MASSRALGIVLFGLLAATAQGWVDIKAPLTSGNRQQHGFNFLIGNYTVEPEVSGVFTVTELNVTDDVTVILFTKASASTFPSHPLYARQPPCSKIDTASDTIIKIYTNQSVVSPLQPEVFQVQSDTMLCYMILGRMGRATIGIMKFEFKDNTDTGRSRNKTISYFRTMMRSKTLFRETTQKCYRANMGTSSIAIDYAAKMMDRTSLNRVIILRGKMEKVYVCTSSRYSGNRCAYERQLKYYNERLITAQTPESLYEWPLVVDTAVCIKFEAVSFRVPRMSDFSRNPLFRISEYPTCDGSYGFTGGNGGIITSPGYPKELYQMDQTCTWNVAVLPGQVISVQFGKTASDCNNDFIMLSGLEDGRKVLCGPSLTGQTFLTASNRLQIKFKTNVYTQLKGFVIRYSAIGCSLTTLPIPSNSVRLNADRSDVISPGFVLRVGCAPGYGFASRGSEATVTCVDNGNGTWQGGIPFCVGYQNCVKEFQEHSGSFSSPGYPGSYPKNATCAWTIKAKRGQRIKLRVDRVKSSCNNDFILLKGMSVTNGQPARNVILCGENVHNGSEYTSSAEVAVVRYQTNVYSEEGYLHMTYEVLGCSPETITQPATPVIFLNTTDFYPSGSKMEAECPAGFRFPIPKKRVTLTCANNGEWIGRIPICFQSTDLANVR